MQEITNHRQRLRSVGATTTNANGTSTGAATGGAVATSRYYNREYESQRKSSIGISRSPTASPNASPLRMRPGSERLPSPYRRDYSRSQHHEQRQEGMEQEEKMTTQSEIGVSRDVGGSLGITSAMLPKAQSVIGVGGISSSGINRGGLNVKDLANRLNSRAEKKSSFRPSWLKNTNVNARAVPATNTDTNQSGSKSNSGSGSAPKKEKQSSKPLEEEATCTNTNQSGSKNNSGSGFAPKKEKQSSKPLEKKAHVSARKESNSKSTESNAHKDDANVNTKATVHDNVGGVLSKAHFWRAQATQRTSPLRIPRAGERDPTRSNPNHFVNQKSTHRGSSSPPRLDQSSSRRVSVSPRRARLREYKAGAKEQKTSPMISNRNANGNGGVKESSRRVSVSPSRQRVDRRDEEGCTRTQPQEQPQSQEQKNVEANMDENVEKKDSRLLSPRRQRLLKAKFESKQGQNSQSPLRRHISVSPTKGRKQLQTQNFQSRIAQFSNGVPSHEKDVRTQSKGRVESTHRAENVEKEEQVLSQPKKGNDLKSKNGIKSETNDGYTHGSDKRDKSHFWKDQSSRKSRLKESHGRRVIVQDRQAFESSSSGTVGRQKNTPVMASSNPKTEGETESIPRNQNQSSPKQSPEGGRKASSPKIDATPHITADVQTKAQGFNGGVNQKAHFWISQQHKKKQDSTITGKGKPLPQHKPEVVQSAPNLDLVSPPRPHSNVSPGSFSPSQSPSGNFSPPKSKIVQTEDETERQNTSSSSADYKSQYMQYMSRNRQSKPKAESSFTSNEDSTEMDAKQQEEFRRSIAKSIKPSERKVTRTWPPTPSADETEEAYEISNKESGPKDLVGETLECRVDTASSAHRTEIVKDTSNARWDKTENRTVLSTPDKSPVTRRKSFEKHTRNKIDAVEESSSDQEQPLPQTQQSHIHQSVDKKNTGDQQVHVRPEQQQTKLEFEERRVSGVERDESSYPRMNKLQQYNRIVKSQMVSPPPSSNSPDSPRKVESSSLLMTPSRSTATTVTTTDESQNMLTPWTTPQRQHVSCVMKGTGSPIKEEIHDECHDNSTVITDTSSFMPVSEVKKKLWDNGEHLKQWRKDGEPPSVHSKVVDDEAQASLFKSRYYRAAEAAQKNCAEHKSVLIQPPNHYQRRRDQGRAMKEHVTPTLKTSTYSERDKSKLVTTETTNSTVKDKSVRTLLAKLSSVQRDNPNTALEVIDSIIENERNSIEDSNEFPSASIESFAGDEDLMSVDSDSSEYDSDDSTVSSITNPTYMSGFGGHSRRQQFSKLVARDGRLSPPYNSKRPSAFLTKSRKNGKARSSELPPRQPHLGSRTAKPQEGMQDAADAQTSRKATNHSARSVLEAPKQMLQKNTVAPAVGSPVRSKDLKSVQPISPVKSFTAKGSSTNNKGLLNKFKDWDEDSSEEMAEMVDLYETSDQNDLGSPNSPGERLKRLAKTLKNDETSLHFNKTRRFLYPQRPDPAPRKKSVESANNFDSWEPSSSTDFFGTNFFKNEPTFQRKDVSETNTVDDENDPFDAFNQTIHMRSNNAFASKELERKFSQVEKAYEKNSPLF